MAQFRQDGRKEKGATGIEVAELPVSAVEAAPAPAERPAEPIEVDEDVRDADPYLLPIALGVAGVIALAAVSCTFPG